MCDYIYIHICLYVYTTFPLYVFGVCLLCTGVKADTKRDIDLQREKHKKGEGGTRALSDFSYVHRENQKTERAKTKTERKNSK